MVKVRAFFEADIPLPVKTYFSKALREWSSLQTANMDLYARFGIRDFFESDRDLLTLGRFINTGRESRQITDRPGFGDFQTSAALADKVTALLASKKIRPEILIEPTCGKGHFIIAALQRFKNIRHIYGIEVYPPYVWACKFAIMDYYLQNPKANRPDISISCQNVFDTDFTRMVQKHTRASFLVLGNPPWVTNAAMGSIGEANLPVKQNFKQHPGLHAITGKGNFDIAENITRQVLHSLDGVNGTLALLVKNSVIRNLVWLQKTQPLRISSLSQFAINSRKEFKASVEASLFYCRLNRDAAHDCTVYPPSNWFEKEKYFGWSGDRFVADTALYTQAKSIDGISRFEWRQGVKHDCAAVMELQRVSDHFINGLQETVTIEADLCYGLVKSAHLKSPVITRPARYTIVTQRKIGDDTRYIKQILPATYRYLQTHKAQFEARKSRIYAGKPAFSIFGVGDYTFKPYKVAVSGLHKSFHFSLVLPYKGKPLVLDDTCYFLSFDDPAFAVFTWVLLNTEAARAFLQSICFSDAKRMLTKEVLMRIDLYQLSLTLSKKMLAKNLSCFNETYRYQIKTTCWDEYLSLIRQQA